MIAAVHAETSTGVRSDLEPLAAGKGDALLLADCVTSDTVALVLAALEEVLGR